MILTLFLIPDDFKNNYYNDNYDCPMARAIKRCDPDLLYVVVGNATAGASLSDKLVGTQFPLPFTTSTLEKMDDIDYIVDLYYDHPIINGKQIDSRWDRGVYNNVKSLIETGDFQTFQLNVQVTSRSNGWQI